MKIIKTRIAQYVLSGILLAGMSSCGGNGTSTDSDSSSNGSSMSDTGSMQSTAGNMADKAGNAADSMGSKMSGMLSGSNPDSSFVLKAGTSNEDEMKLLQAGIDKGTSKELKAHAKMMLADHKKMGQEVKGYAAPKKYSTMNPSDSKGNDQLADINKNSVGKDWDKAWTDVLVKGHQETIDLFEDGQSNVKDPTLKGMITKTLPTLRSHLTMVQGLQGSMK